MIDCRLSISSRGDGWTSDNVLRASMEISDNFATVAYKLEGDDCTLTLSPRRAEQSRSGEVPLRLTFVPGEDTVCIVGTGGLRGGYRIHTDVFNCIFGRAGVSARIEYFAGDDREHVKLDIRAIASRR